MWSRRLVERVEPPSCSCPRTFNPVTRREEPRCPRGSPVPLTQLSRHAIMAAIPLNRLEAAWHCLPLPRMLRNHVCQLKMEDFYINPHSVCLKNIQSDIYNATVLFSGQKVRLLVTRRTASLNEKPPDLSRCGLLTVFKEKDVMVYVYRSGIRLDEVLQGFKNAGKRVPTALMWKVVKAVSKSIIENPFEASFLQSDITFHNSVVFVYPSSSMPDNLLVIDENNRGATLHYPSSTAGIGHLIISMLSVNRRTKVEEMSVHEHMLHQQRRHLASSTTEESELSTARDDLMIASLIDYCMDARNQSKAGVRKILREARKALGEELKLPSII